MGFLSFNEKYYAAKLDEFEGHYLTDGQLYEAKQLFKVLCDLADEGYSALGDDLESKFHGVSRLKEIIKRGGAQPFPISPRAIQHEYGAGERDLRGFLDVLTSVPPSDDVQTESASLIEDIAKYCEWLDGQGGGAYIFLLRDCLLPYAYFAANGRDGLYAYPIGRAFLRDLSGVGDFDDIIRLPIYCAAEEGITDFAEFGQYFKCATAKTLRTYPHVKNELARLLDAIPYEEITVVESGYCGTIPMLLSAIDDRVAFRMYTTAPFFFELYKDKTFCRRYEQLRLFETLYSQDALFEYSSFKEGKFFVKISADDGILRKAKEEIASIKSYAQTAKAEV